MARIIMEPNGARLFPISGEIPDEVALRWLGLDGSEARMSHQVVETAGEATPVAVKEASTAPETEPHTTMPSRVITFMQTQTPDRVCTIDELIAGLALEEWRRPSLYGCLNRLTAGETSPIIRITRGKYRLRVATGAAS